MKKTILLLATIFVASMGYSQENTSDTIDARLTAIEKVLDKLPKISGFINTVYTYNDSEEEVNTANVRHIWLDFKGDLSKKIDYRILTNFAGGLTVLDAYARFKFSKAFTVLVGQGKNPIVLENPYHPIHWGTVDCSFITSKYLRTAGRDIGVSASGSFFPREGFDMLYYMVGVYNGAGINCKDNNKGKDVGARIDFNPAKPITISVSMYEGNIGERGYGSKLNRYGASLRYVDEKILFRTEYMTGVGAYNTNYQESTSQGFYAIAGYKIIPAIMPVVKYDFFDENINVSNNSCANYTIGIHSWPTKFLCLDLNYTYHTFSSSLQKEYSQIDAAVSVIF